MGGTADCCCCGACGVISQQFDMSTALSVVYSYVGAEKMSENLKHGDTNYPY